MEKDIKKYLNSSDDEKTNEEEVEDEKPKQRPDESKK